ncbi:MAG: cytochrome oxidase putative small subunit CydP [Rhizomicrobium sp.]
MTEAKLFQKMETAHVGDRSLVCGDSDFRINHFWSCFGRRKLDGAKLGGEQRQMSRAGGRRPLLWREIAILLSAKLVALACLYFLFFGPSHRPLVDTVAVSAQILGFHHR